MVFYLLETLYSAFDKLADVRKVFKVETIGDSCKYRQVRFTDLVIVADGAPISPCRRRRLWSS
jgi:Adenylate and Guanylate cyclase catalytic domain